MSKISKLFTFLFLLVGLTAVNAQVFITELADPNNNAGVRYIELYNAGSSAVDFTEGSNWRIDKYTNASTTVSQTLNLNGTIPANGFFIIATGTDDGDFLSTYGVSADQFDGADNDVAGSNGDDNLELYDGTGTLVDQFGVPGEDGTGTNHEFEDGRAERIATITTGNPTWVASEWNISSDAITDGTRNAPQDFDPGVWPPEAPTAPTVPAPTPTVDAADVISLFSNAYTNVVVDTWSASWDAADVADTLVAGDDTKLYTNLVYAGIETTTNVIDASSMTHFHMDIWTPDSITDSTVFRIKLVDFGADGVWGGAGSDDVEHEITLIASTNPAAATGEWISIDLPLSDFTGLVTREHLAQYIISGDPNTVFVDNMYFYNDSPAAPYYLAGDFQGWDASSTPLYDDGTNGDLVADDGIYSLEYSLATSGSHEWKVTNGTWDTTWPTANSWFLSITDPQTVLFTFNTNSIGDGWLPDQNICNTNELKPTELVAVGDFQSEEGESGDWNNASTVTAMHDDGLDGDWLSGDGIFCYHMTSLPTGTYAAKGVKTGEWNGWGADGRSVDAQNISFTTTSDNQDVYLYVNVNTGRSLVTFEAIQPISVPTNVFFSEYIEGGGNNKALEIFNGSDSEINLSDYVIRINYNGNPYNEVFSFSPNAKLAAGDVYVIAHEGAVSEITDVADTLIVNPYSGGTSYITVFNGDDVRALCYVNGTDTTTVDIIGAYDGVDPGAGWAVAGVADATKDHSLVRKASVTAGNTDWALSAGTTTEDSEWEVYDKDVVSYLGQHPGEKVVIPNLFFSEYIEGGGDNKALEIYNASDSEVDLDNFVVRINYNGNPYNEVFSFTPGTKLSAGDVFVIALEGAATEITDVADTLIVNPYSGGTSYITAFNGDDVRALCYVNGTDTTTVDIIGAYDGVDPGAGWAVAGVADGTKDHTLVRKETVTMPNPDWVSSAGTTTDDSEWKVYDKDELSYIGVHPGKNVAPSMEPLVAAPAPTIDSANVISLYSNAYNNVLVDTWSTSWDVADVADTLVAGDDTKLYTNLVYAGIETVSQVIDASEMTHFHMDIWTPDSTEDPAVFKIKLVDFGADGVWSGGDDVEHEITLSAATTPALATGEWVSIDLPLSDFTGLVTREHMAQYIISGDPNTVYVDNMYFYKVETPLFYSDFEVDLGDWTPYSVASTKNWSQKTGTGANGTSGYAEMNGYQEDVISNDYLITGPFNSNNYTGEYLEFWSAAKYGNFDAELTLEYSTDYDGTSDPSGFTWTVLTFTRPVDNNDTWTNSGKVNIADLTSGAVYFAFHYLSDGTQGRWKIDEFGIYGTPNEGVDLPPVVESVERNVVIPDANQNTDVTAVVTDDNTVASVDLIYSKDGATFTTVAMTNTSGDSWDASIPEAFYDDGDLFGYYVVAKDNIDQVDTSAVYMLFAGNTPIETLKNSDGDGIADHVGVPARVTGTVSAGSGTYSSGRIEAYMEDATAGILVIAFGTETPAMVENNSYTVTGKIKQYNGLIEIEPMDPATDIVDNGSVTPLEPMMVTLSEINAEPSVYGSRLIKVSSVELSTGTEWLGGGSSSGSNMDIYVGTDTLTLRVDADTDIWGSTSPTFPQDITGVLGQYDSSIPYTAGYQLLPRSLADFGDPVSVGDDNGLPTVYSLNQNFPNPFNPTTNIQFSIPENGLVTLKVFDILGREVMTLVNEELPASYQTVEFDGSSLTSGIYFYRIQVNSFTSVKKMILMK